MNIDGLSIAAIVMVLVAFGGMIAAHISGRREYQRKIAALSKRMDTLHQTQNVSGLHTPEFRELCCVIREMYPQALHGVDYHIGDDGEGPFIREWYYDAPQPDEETLRTAILRHREEMRANNYREKRRAAYPSIEDQLDALHKARNGDDAHLRVIEAHIQKVKDKYPKGKDCEHTDCSHIAPGGASAA